MLNIMLNKDFRLISDDNQFIVQRLKGLRAARKGEGKEENWESVSYHSSLGGALKSWRNRMVRLSDATEFQDLSREVIDLDKQLEAIMQGFTV